MTLSELDKFFRDFLKPEEYLSDPSKNGIQISNSSPESKQIKKIGFAITFVQFYTLTEFFCL